MNRQTIRRRALAGILSLCVFTFSFGLPAKAASPTVPDSAKPFRTAEGYGSHFSLSGQPVYHVTNLNDSGAGSLRDAISQPNRDIVFDVGGTISIQSPLSFPSNITVEGQTAPSPGITVYGMNTSLHGVHNVIIRYMRFREGINAPSGACSLAIDESYNVIVDHTSIEYGRWDDLHLENDRDITLQYCIIGQGIDPQRFGCLMGGDDRITIHHCLWIDNSNRNPKIKGNVEYADNVVYNWGQIGIQGAHSGAVTRKDMINNYLIAGPNSSPDFMSDFTGTDQVYSSGNYVDMNRDGQLNGRLVTEEDIRQLTATVEPQRCMDSGLTITTARQAYQTVLNEAGSSLYRDSEDQRLMDELQSLGKTGEIIRNDVTREPLGTRVTTGLENAIHTAQSALSGTQVGTAPGECPQAAFDALNAAVAQADATLADSTNSQTDLDAQAAALRNAITVFRNAIIPRSPIICRFDFGIKAFQIADGYTGITVNPKGGKNLALGAYSKGMGYGFADLGATVLIHPVEGRDDNTQMVPPDNDYVVAQGVQFLVDLPNGIYNVAFTSAYYTQTSSVTVAVNGINGAVTSQANEVVIGEIDNVPVEKGQLAIVFPQGTLSRCTQIVIRRAEAPDSSPGTTPPETTSVSPSGPETGNAQIPTAKPDSSTGNPKTGDAFPLHLYLMGCALSLAVIAAIRLFSGRQSLRDDRSAVPHRWRISCKK